MFRFKNTENQYIVKYQIILIFILFFLCFFYYNYDNVFTYITPSSDLAADLLLTNKIYSDGYLLTGHYSRFQFNHPGPFFFYWNFLFEQIFGCFLPSRINTWYLGAVTLNSLLLTLAIHLLSNQFTLLKLNFSIKIIFTLLLLYFFYNLDLWMPSRIVIPFYLFLITLPFVMQHQYKYLPLSMILAGILIHGYVVQPIIVLPLLFLSLFFSIYIKKFKISHYDIKCIVLTLCIGLLFAFPLLLDIFNNGLQSNLFKILAVASHNKESSTVYETMIFIKKYFDKTINLEIIILISLGLSALFYSKKEVRKFILFLMIINLICTIIFFSYYSTAPKPLYEFIGRYFISVLISIYSIFILVIFTSDIKKVIKYFSFMLILFMIYNLNIKSQLPKQGIQIKQLSNEIMKNTKEYGMARINYEEHMMWGVISGILFELSEKKYPSCTTWSHMSFLFTEKRICDKNTLPNIKLVNIDKCNGNCVYKDNKYGLIKESFIIEPTEILDFKTSKVHFNNWSGPEKSHRWSNDNISKIIFNINDLSIIRGYLNLHIGTLGKQEIKLSLNGHYIGSQTVNSWDTNITFNFDKSLLNKDTINQIEFKFPNARKPNNGDQRVLAMALKSFSIE